VDPDNLVSKFGIYTGGNLGDGTDESTMKSFQEGLDYLLSNRKELEGKGFESRKYIEGIYSFKMFEKNLHNILGTQFKRNFEL
jgi:hypothetical protein